MKRSTLCLALAIPLLTLTPALAQDAKLDPQIELEVPESAELTVPAILETVATKLKAVLIVSPSVRSLQIKFANRSSLPLKWSALKKILRFHDVIVHESQPSGPKGPWLLQVMGAREVQTRSGGPNPFVSPDQIPAHDEVVTAVFKIKHGAASAIYANLRGILARDPTRSGNILYIQGPELVIVTDLSRNVVYYRSLIQTLDRPVLGASCEVSVYEVPASIWERVKPLSDAESAAALGKLASEGKVTRHEEARVKGRTFSLESNLVQEDGSSQALVVRVSKPENVSNARARLMISLQRQGKDRQGRQVELDAPSQSQTSLVSAVLGSGPASPHLVIVFRPR